MKTTETDKKIVKTIIENASGLTIKQICSTLNIKYENRRIITRRIEKLTQNNIIRKIRSYPRLYQINNMGNNREDLILTECPKCSHNNIIYKGQSKKVCEKCKHRYDISKKRKRKFVPTI